MEDSTVGKVRKRYYKSGLRSGDSKNQDYILEYHSLQ